MLVLLVLVGAEMLSVNPDQPGEENGAEEGPVGNGGGDAGGGTALQTPDLPVRVSVYQPQAPKAEKTPPRTETPKPKTETPPAATEAPTETTPGPEGTGDAATEGVAGRAPRGNKKPCEPVEEIEQLGPTKWKVERSLIDWYAVHLRELEKQAGVAPVKADESARAGARLYLPRCSVLRQAGFHGGDIIHSVNGHAVTTIAAGVKTYALVRNDKKLVVELTRKNGTQLTLEYKLVK